MTHGWESLQVFIQLNPPQAGFTDYVILAFWLKCVNLRNQTLFSLVGMKNLQTLGPLWLALRGAVVILPVRVMKAAVCECETC